MEPQAETLQDSVMQPPAEITQGFVLFDKKEAALIRNILASSTFSGSIIQAVAALDAKLESVINS